MFTNGLYSFQDFSQSGLGNPNTISRKGPSGAFYIDLETGKIYRKRSAIYAAKGWEEDIPGLPSKAMRESFVGWSSTDQVSTLTQTGLVRATTGNLLHITTTPGGLNLGTVALGTQTIAIAANTLGLDVSGDQTDNDGYEVFSHFAGASGNPFVVGRDPAFFFETSLSMANVSGCDTMLVGFRRAQVNDGTYTNYLDYACLGWDAAAASATIDQLTGLNGTDTATSTTETLADGIIWNVRIEVSTAGVVTFKHSQGQDVALAVPTAGAAFTLDAGDPVIPFVHFLQGTAADSGATYIKHWETGYLGA